MHAGEAEMLEEVGSRKWEEVGQLVSAGMYCSVQYLTLHTFFAGAGES